MQDAGLDVVSLDDAVQRLKQGDDRRFASFTFDDGYRDVAEHAWPLFKLRSLPLTLYLPTDFIDGRGELWWFALEQVIARADEIELCRDGALWRLDTATVPDKIRAFDDIYWWLRTVDEATQRRVVRELAERYDVDMAGDCHKLVMDWDQVRTLAADPLVTIGAHTKGSFCHRQAPPTSAPMMRWSAVLTGSSGELGAASGPFEVSLMAIPKAPAHAISPWRSRPASRPR